MTILYKLVYILTLPSLHVVPVQDGLTEQTCVEQILYLKDAPLITKGGKEKMSGYICIPQRVTGV